jgi:hypothetical protein
MKKIDWKAEFKKLTYSKGVDPQKMEITPFRDWRVVVIVFFGGLAVSLSFNIYMSIEINKDSFFATAPKSSGVVKFNEEGLAKVIVGIDEKAARFEKAKAEGVAIVDPSL